jgi:AcrR family transcriptional regulator
VALPSDGSTEDSTEESRALDAAALDAAELTLRRRGTKVKVRPAQDVAERLAAAAIRLFQERGFDAVSVGDIAAEAGVTTRTFFRYYPTKETVLVDIVDRTNERLMQYIQSVRPGAEIGEVLRVAMDEWFLEYTHLFHAVRRFVEGASSLMPVFLTRFAVWEEHLAEALRARYPELDAEDAMLWSVLAFGLLRVAQNLARLRACSYAEGAREAFTRFDGMLDVARMGPGGARDTAPRVEVG